MPKGLIFVVAEGGKEMQQLNKRLKRASNGQVLKKRLKTEIETAGEPVVRDLKAAVKRVNVTVTSVEGANPNRRRRSSRKHSTGLRDRVARATRLSVTPSGIRLKVSARKVGPYGATLPKYLDASIGRYDRWRHPVFFSGSISEAPVVVQQKGSPYWFNTIAKHRADFRRACFAAMEDVSELITDE